MGMSEDYRRLKQDFSIYLDSIDGTGYSMEVTSLGGIVALFALRDSGQRLPQNDNPADFLSKLVTEFEHKYFHRFNRTYDVYYVPHTQHALHRFLYSTEYLSLDVDIDIVNLLDDFISSSPSHMRMEGRTPKGIAELMSNLVDVKPRTSVFDPAMGSGDFLTAAIGNAQAEIDFTGIENNNTSLFIASFKAILTNNGKHTCLGGDVFDYTASLPKYDIVLSNPPFRRLSKNELRFRHGELTSSDMSFNIIELGLKHLKQSGKAAFLVPIGSLFSSGDAEKVRESWIKRKLLTTVISLPAGVLHHTRMKCAILLFENIQSHNNSEIKLINAEDCFTNISRSQVEIGSDEISNILSRFKKLPNNNLGKEVSVKDIADNKYCLLPSLYLEEKQNNSNFISNNWKTIGELADVFQGTPLSKTPEGKEPIIQGRNLRVDNFDHDNLQRKDLSGVSKTIKRCKAGDILLQRIGANPAAYLVTPNEKDFVIADTVFVIRFHDCKPEIISFIVQYINSGEVANRINNARSYSVVPTQNLKSVRVLEVPIPDDEVIHLVNEMDKLESSLKAEYEKAIEYKKALFGGEDTGDIITNLGNARFTLNALESALSKKDDIRYRVRTQYPFPLAYAYRNIYLDREYAGIYEKQMKYGEQFLSFLVSVGLSLIAKYRKKLNNSDITSVIEEFKSYVDRGISPGDLQSVLQRCCKMLSRIDDVRIAKEFAQVWFKSKGKKESDFAQATKEDLVVRLNDYKHHRGPANSHEKKQASEKQTEVLEKMLADIEFCSEWKLILIEDVNKGWRSHEHEYTASLLKGDHPAFERIHFSTDASLSKDKLYIQYDNDFICLYPQMSLVYNEKTKREEIFSIDKKSNNGLRLRSFDSGSSIDSREIKDDYEYWVDHLQ